MKMRKHKTRKEFAMIVRREWQKRITTGSGMYADETTYNYVGYFLFGVIPLYIERN